MPQISTSAPPQPGQMASLNSSVRACTNLLLRESLLFLVSKDFDGVAGGEAAPQLPSSCTEADDTLALFLIAALLRRNSHTIQFTHGSVQFSSLYYIHSIVQPSPESILEHFYHSVPISGHFPFSLPQSLATTNLLSVYGFACSGRFI